MRNSYAKRAFCPGLAPVIVREPSFKHYPVIIARSRLDHQAKHEKPVTFGAKILKPKSLPTTVFGARKSLRVLYVERITSLPGARDLHTRTEF